MNCSSICYYIPVCHDMMRQTNDCSPVRVMQHKVKYFLYLQVDPARGRALPAGLVQPCPKPRALIHKQNALRPSRGVSEAHLLLLVSLEQSQLKPIGRYGGGLLRFALGGKWGSSLPLEQHAGTPWKIIEQGLVPLKFFDFHFIWKYDKFIGLFWRSQ